jgi:hypothetical protein
MVTCSLCAATPEGGDPNPLGWACERDPRRGMLWTCPACTRRHSRAIEGRLDQDWW